MAGIYLHIPFCRKKCSYCNFFSVGGAVDIRSFVDSLHHEMMLRKDYLSVDLVETIYFGGGTPSLLSSKEIGFLINEIRMLFNYSPFAEITIETNPDDISPKTIEDWAKAGINRISVGIQSLCNKDLLYLGRSHNAASALKAIELLQAGPVKEISADLIYGIPGQDDDQWIINLKTLAEHGVQHISAYALTVEDKTPLKLNIQRGLGLMPDEDQTVKQYIILLDVLESFGYEHYEISNFCLPGHHSRHNSSYWSGEKYLGLGPSAHSFNGTSRQWNLSSISGYLDATDAGLPFFEIEVLTDQQRFNEYIMTGIRTSAGIDLIKINEVFGQKKADSVRVSVKGFVKKNWIEIQGDILILTKNGKLFADLIASELFWVEN